MFKTLFMIIAVVIGAIPVGSAHSGREQKLDKTRAVEGLPFCALVLRVFVREKGARVVTYLLMDPEEVTEQNLRMLFEKISAQHASAPFLESMVYTDVEQLGFLATHQAHSGLPNLPAKELQSAYYRRDDRVEFFRYTPDYPRSGLKTIVLRGKE